MKIAVIAANGRTGQAFVERALTAGHEIRAGVHSTASLPDHPNLTLVTCDATNLDDVRTLIAGAEAVVCLIGHMHGSPPRVQTTAIINAVSAMHEAGLRRIVSLTGAGVRFPGDTTRLSDLLFNIPARFVPAPRISDGAAHAKVLQQSGLDWTLLRVLRLTNGPPRPFALREHGPAKLSVSRQEVAAAILDVLERGSFIGQAPIIGRP